MKFSRVFLAPCLFALGSLACTAAWTKPDITVAADGTGDFKTVQAAVASIPRTNNERIVVLIKDGVYKEKVRVDASFVTLRGQSRQKARIEFPQLNDDFTAHPDEIGRAVLNLNRANDFVLENLTAFNTAGVVGPHAFTIYGTGDKTVLVDCDVLSDGADTVSLWLADSGKYYHARCNFRGSVDFVCPRGWCYATDCTFYEMKNTAAVWHDGARNPEMKFVLRNCRFDGVPGWNLARHHHDAQFYFLGCLFSNTMTNLPPFRVIYPNDPKRNADLDKSNLWGERSYFYHCRRNGGDYDWLRDNLNSATNAPAPEEVTAQWTFAGKWDPEREMGPVINGVTTIGTNLTVVFSEAVTVKGKPQLRLAGGGLAGYYSGSGTDKLVFQTAGSSEGGRAKSLKLNGGAILACEASVSLRSADLRLPK